ncbi:unnamed protein product [Diabrotica balteata]|uniref:Uncharacterized protein n=1 Tax=Diabrotica balteata TaxID=107213 RepID=A0A9N9SLE9_DIABA|nr:unnamed protein product [Diabrotica balteata]
MNTDNDIAEHNLYSDDSEKDNTYEPGDDVDLNGRKRRWNFGPSTSAALDDDSSSDSEGIINRTATGDAYPIILAEDCSRSREFRKKFRRKALWKRSKAHRERNFGKENTDRKGKHHAARTLKN